MSAPSPLTVGEALAALQAAEAARAAAVAAHSDAPPEDRARLFRAVMRAQRVENLARRRWEESLVADPKAVTP